MFPFDFNDVNARFGVVLIKKSSGRETMVPPSGNVDCFCPFCGGKANYNADKQVFHCWNCDTVPSGGILGYVIALSSLPSSPVSPLKTSKEAMRYMMTGVSKEDAESRKKEMEKRAAKVKEEPELPLDTRDRLYNHMLSLLTLDDSHKKEMSRRGLQDGYMKQLLSDPSNGINTASDYLTYLGYTTMPHDRDSARRLAVRMMDDGYNVKGLPGFYMDESNDFTLVRSKKGILVPVRSLEGQVEGFQIRKDQDLLKTFPKKDRVGNIAYDQNGNVKMETENKYVCLSSSGKKFGGKMHAVTHYAGPRIWSDEYRKMIPVLRKNSIKFTEGPMKGDVYYGLTNEPILCVLGVNNVDSLKDTLLKLKAYYPSLDTVEDCLDMDYLTNNNVRKSVEKARKMILSLGFKYVRRTWNPKFKGIDDFALAVKQGVYTK